MFTISHNERKSMWERKTDIQIKRKRIPYCQNLSAERKTPNQQRSVGKWKQTLGLVTVPCSAGLHRAQAILFHCIYTA